MMVLVIVVAVGMLFVIGCGRMGTSLGTYDCGSGYTEESYVQMTEKAVKAYGRRLEKSGYVRYSEHAIGDNTFVTYTKDDQMLHTSWYPADSRFNVVYGPLGYLPETEEPEYEAVVTPSVTQLERGGAGDSAAGLLLIVQLADGSYVVIDGGHDFGGDGKRLLEFLTEHNPVEGKPRVTWMFTHAHGDHMELALNFLAKYEEEIELQMACFNFPDFKSITVTEKQAKGGEERAVMLQKILKKKYPEAETYIFHTGDRLLLPGCEIEFLKTHEEFWPDEFRDFNETCAAWRMTIEGKTMLVLGDCLERSSQWMANVYGQELKSDILQVTHHGYNGGLVELYQWADPDICLWPVDQNRFDSDERLLGTLENYSYNAWLRDASIKERTHYTAGRTVTLIYPWLVEE